MSTYTCPNCGELFKVVYTSGTFPGGKEREDIDCPDCFTTVSSEVTSATLKTVALSAEEKAAYKAGRLR